MVRVTEPRPTTVSSLSVTKSIEFRPWVKSHLSLVGEPIQVGVFPRDQAVAHREDVSARDSERLAFSGAAHDIFRDEVLHTRSECALARNAGRALRQGVTR